MKKRDEVAPAASVKKSAEGSLRMKLRNAAETKAAVANPARSMNKGSTNIARHSTKPALSASVSVRRRRTGTCAVGHVFGGAERDRTVDLLNAISAFVSRHTRTPPDSTFYRGPHLSGFVRQLRTGRETTFAAAKDSSTNLWDTRQSRPSPD